MKERPILFSGPMVRAILEGRKTVTRRVIKNPPADGWSFDGEFGRITSPHPRRGRFGAFIRRGVGTDFPEMDVIPCPWGMPGDRLWARETYADIGCRLTYRADTDDGAHCKVKKWTPAIHMFRKDSRILLEVTDVRVERLQAGEGETAFESRYLAEGINRIHYGDGEYYYHAFESEPGPGNWIDPFDAWRELWESINGAESWSANPWVWVIEFRRMAP